MLLSDRAAVPVSSILRDIDCVSLDVLAWGKVLPRGRCGEGDGEATSGVDLSRLRKLREGLRVRWEREKDEGDFGVLLPREKEGVGI